MNTAAATQTKSSKNISSPSPTQSDPPASGVAVRQERNQDSPSRVMVHAPAARPPVSAHVPGDTPEAIDKVELREDQLTAYLSLLVKEGVDVTVYVKNGPSGPVRQLARLPELHRLLLEKRIWGAHVHHQLGGTAVVDTLTVHQSGVVRHRARA